MLKGELMLDKFVVQVEWADAWVDLTDEEMGILFRKFITYAKGEEMELENRIVKSNWLSVIKDIDRMTAKYLKDIENGKLGGAPKGNKNASKQPKINPETTQEQPTNNPNTTYKYKDKYNYKEKDKSNDKDKSNEKEKLKIYNDNKSSIHYIMDLQDCSIDDAITIFLLGEKDYIY